MDRVQIEARIAKAQAEKKKLIEMVNHDLGYWDGQIAVFTEMLQAADTVQTAPAEAAAAAQ